jgi:capsule polysaccharide export protein KpsE/RkpR
VTEDPGGTGEALAALAAQIADLRGQLARSQGDVGHLRARLEASTGQVMKLLVEVKQLRKRVQHQQDRLGEALEARQLEPVPAPWWCVGAEEGEAMLAGLRDWVDGFARRHYPGYLARLPRCWPNHPEAVWELSTLRAEWERVYAEPENAELQGALTWHDKFLPGVLGRLAGPAGSIKCDETGCRVWSPPRA